MGNAFEAVEWALQASVPLPFRAVSTIVCVFFGGVLLSVHRRSRFYRNPSAHRAHLPRLALNSTHRLLAAAAILARAAAVKFRFALPVGLADFAAPFFLACRALWVAAIFALTAADNVFFFTVEVAVAETIA